eukprot:1419236-Rhodomonas_salina.1
MMQFLTLKQVFKLAISTPDAKLSTSYSDVTLSMSKRNVKRSTSQTRDIQAKHNAVTAVVVGLVEDCAVLARVRALHEQLADGKIAHGDGERKRHPTEVEHRLGDRAQRSLRLNGARSTTNPTSNYARVLSEHAAASTHDSR